MLTGGEKYALFIFIHRDTEVLSIELAGEIFANRNFLIVKIMRILFGY